MNSESNRFILSRLVSTKLPKSDCDNGTVKVKVEIFADFQCPACIVFSENIQPIFEEYAASGKLTIEFRQFPLTMHKNAMGDALAALCSAEQ